MRGKILFLVSLLTVCLLGIETLGQDSEIVAKIGDEIIRKQDLEVRRPKSMAGSVEDLQKIREMAMDLKKVLNETIDLTLMAMEAKKTDVVNNPALKAKIRYYVDGLIVQEYVDHYIDSLISVSENEILDFYKTSPKYREKEVIRARHILVKKKEEAEEILNKIKAGEDFSKLAKDRSIDESSRENGGDIGWFGRGMMVGPFEEVAFSLKEGEVSGAVETIFGYHIIRLDNRKMSPPAELEKVRPEIIKQIMAKKKNEFVAKKLEALRASTAIEILSDKLKDQK
jgi:parvulin-like peptidyl-prolyl isomerase